MGILDKLKSTAQQAVNSAAQSAGNRRATFSFSALPESLAEMQVLPEAGLDSPFKTAADGSCALRLRRCPERGERQALF